MLGAGETPAASATTERLVRAGLLSPTQVPGESSSWWSPHRIVTDFVREHSLVDAEQTHADLGKWYEQEGESNGLVLFATRGVDHFLVANRANDTWPMARRILIWPRDAGRYREALTWPQRVLAHNPTGWQKGMAMAFECQVGRLAGVLPSDPEQNLKEALTLVKEEEQSFVLDELAKLYQRIGDLPNARKSLEESIEVETKINGALHKNVAAVLHALAGVLKAQGDLDGARARLERSLEIKAEVFGTELHPDVAASLHELAGVLKAQGDLDGARARLERSLEIKAEVFGTELHPDVAASLHELAGVLQAQGDLDGARARLEQARWRLTGGQCLAPSCTRPLPPRCTNLPACFRIRAIWTGRVRVWNARWRLRRKCSAPSCTRPLPPRCTNLPAC